MVKTRCSCVGVENRTINIGNALAQLFCRITCASGYASNATRRTNWVTYNFSKKPALLFPLLHKLHPSYPITV